MGRTDSTDTEEKNKNGHKNGNETREGKDPRKSDREDKQRATIHVTGVSEKGSKIYQNIETILKTTISENFMETKENLNQNTKRAYHVVLEKLIQNGLL